MRGKCNCGKKAVVKFLNVTPPHGHVKHGSAHDINFCGNCRPKCETENFYIIDGK